MKLLKHSRIMLLTVGMMALALTACGSDEEANKGTKETTTAIETKEITTAGEASSDATTITEDEAINLGKAEMGEDFSYIPADELEEKDAVNYTGEYVRTGDVAEVTFVVSEDGTFEMITTGEVNQVVSGLYKLGITDSASVIELLLYPNKNVTDGKEEVVENVEGTAVIEGDKLTLRMESEDTVFIKK